MLFADELSDLYKTNFKTFCSIQNLKIYQKLNVLHLFTSLLVSIVLLF